MKAKLFIDDKKNFYIYYNSHGENLTFKLNVPSSQNGHINIQTDTPGLPDKYLIDARQYIWPMIEEL